MDYLKKLSLGSRVSFVLYLMDDYTGEPVRQGSIKLHFPYCGNKPTFKQDGSIVFCNLVEGEYKIGIFSQEYLDEEVVIQVPIPEAKNLIILKSLKPKPSYPFNGRDTLLRISVYDKNGDPLKNIPIRCEITECDLYRAKIVRSALKEGDSSFYVSSINGKISRGDCYLIKMEAGNAEECIIEEKLEDLRHYKTQKSFQYDHSRGSVLMPFIKTRTDENGEAVIYFRSPPAKRFEVLISIGDQNNSYVNKFCVEEGRTSYIAFTI